MTPLTPVLVRRIATTGPMTIADYMTECLWHPVHGYYAQSRVVGAAGDFVTAPEISQMFGELIGLALAQAWRNQGAPAPMALVELGPGRGTLMADLLRAAQAVPAFAEAVEIHLVEASPRLRAEQSARIPEAHWHRDVATLPDLPTFAIANEFFDALPIRQFQKQGKGWAERVVGAQDEGLVIGLAPPVPQPDLASRLPDTADGGIIERRPAGGAILGDIARTVAERGGAILVVDYGDWRSRGDTLQAVEGHRTVDPLAAPGRADLSAHVDFEEIAAAAMAAGLAAPPILTQGAFLDALGVGARTEALARGLSGDALAAHRAAHRRLTHADEMGSLFKVAGYHPPDAAPLPGWAG